MSAHVAQLAGPVAAEYLGADFEPDWRVERDASGLLRFVVVDWQGETIASGLRATFGEAVTQAVRWAS